MKKICIFICLLAVCYQTFAQTSSTNGQDEIALPTMIPPAPTVANLMHFEEVSVDLYSGQPSISIPLGNISVSDKLSYPISIHYNTKGVRIDERSGWLGTGFSMAASGVISRTVRGIPDENNSQGLGRGVFHTQYSDFDLLTNEQAEEFLWRTANGIDQNDTQYDLFQYNFFGKGGRFIVKNVQGQLTPIIIGDFTNDIIEIEHDTNFVITKFTVTDTNGYVYTFEETSLNAIYNNTVTISQDGSSSSASTTMGNGAVNAWYLKDVKLPNGTILCSFTYQEVQENYHTPVSTTRNQLLGTPTYGTANVQALNRGMLLPKEISSSQLIYSTQKYVDEMTTLDGTKVKFVLDANGHPEFLAHTVNTNVSSGGKLAYVQVFQPNGDLHKQIDFSFTTSTNNRLFLTNISEVYGGETLEYALSYENMDELPSFGSNLKDTWGYYNGDYNNISSYNINPIGRTVNATKITTGTLAAITYPLGGKKEFTFQSNDFSYQGTNNYDYAKIPENRQIYTRSGNLNIDLGDEISANQLLLYIDEGQRVKVNKDSLVTQSCTDLSKHVISISKVQPKSGVTVTPPSNGNYFGTNTSDFEYVANNFSYTLDINTITDFLTVSSGWYFVELRTPQVELTPCDYSDTAVDITIDLDYTEFNLVTKVMKGGGLRIKEIVFTDENDELQKTTYNYKDNHLIEDFSAANIDDFISSGSYEANMNKRIYTKGKIHPFIQDYICNTIDPSVYRVHELVEYQVTRDLNEVLTPTTKGNYVGYKKVYVKKENAGGELYTFISPRDIEILTSDNTDYPFFPVENKDYKRGMVEKKEVFDESQKLLVEETYTYTDVSTVVESPYFMYEFKDVDCPWDQFYNTYNAYKNNTIENHSDICGPELAVERSVGTCHSADIDPNVGVSTDIRAVAYDYVKGIKLPDEVVRTEYYYDENNIASQTVTTTKKIYNSKQRLKEKTTEFLENGVTTIYKEETRYPYDYYAAEFSTAEQTVLDDMVLINQIEEPVQSKQYKNGALIYDIQRIYDEFHTDIFRVAEIKSAKDGAQKESRVQYHGYTNLGKPIELSQTDGTHLSYVWGYNQMYPLAKIEDASYNTMTAAQFTAMADAVTASDTDVDAATEEMLQTKLEALRAAFPDKMVTSLTYDPMIGVTRTTDPRGYTSYFTYDEVHRLKQVKDAEQNIISANEYFYRNSNNTLENYVKTTLYQHALQNTASAEDWQKIASITYTDGIGRAKQTVAIGQGANYEDIITPFAYDDLGRQTKEFLPYAATSLQGGIHANMFTAQLNFYNTAKYENTTNPFSEKSLENSPLNRMLEQAAPGADWALDVQNDTDHTIKMDYQTNSYNGVANDTAYDNVRYFDVNFGVGGYTDISLTENGHYQTGELYKSVTKDENWQPNQTSGTENDHTTEEFADKLGRVILKRTYDAGTRHDTYYVYDDFGNLTYVLPPEAAAIATIDAATLDNLCYQYTYDSRNRLTQKKIPGKGWEYIVYDKLDRPVLTQDANLRVDRKWLFTKYDALGRIVYTGLYTVPQIDTDDRVSVQAAADGNTQLFEERTIALQTFGGTDVHYSNNIFPNTDIEVLTVDYYDDYLWIGNHQFQPDYTVNSQSGITISGNSITSNTNGWGNAGFTTEGTISKDGFIAYTVPTLNKLAMIGLSAVDSAPNNHFNTIDYAIYTGYGSSQRVYLYREGILEPTATIFYNAGDTFKVERIGSQIVFKKNDEIFYAFNNVTTATLIGDAAFGTSGAEITDMHIGYSAIGQAFTQQTDGLSTGNLTKVLGTSDWTVTKPYYDEKARPIHSVTNTQYLDISDEISSLLDFTGKVIKMIAVHTKKGQAPIVNEERFHYDHAGRLRYQTSHINGQTNELIAKHNYDALGQLEMKQVGGALPKLSTYTNLVNITVSGNIITKDNVNGWNGGISTAETISGDGYMEYQVLDSNGTTMAGLSDVVGDSSNGSIKYAIYNATSGILKVYESGTDKGTFGTYVPGDIFRVERIGNRIHYMKNNVTFYVSPTIDNGDPLLADVSMYQALDQIQDLVLVDLESELQEVDFTYNVRGWLKGINATQQANDLFSFGLTYNDIADQNKKLYNGNISSTLWKTMGQDTSQRSYEYTYDALNRLKTATDNTGNYNVNSITYDRNGNIETLVRKGHTNTGATSFDTMDNLAYSYFGNQLLNVTDASSISFGFNDGNVHTTNTEDPTNVNNDYVYDANGNMVVDQNKDITNISYNHLNLPTHITFGNGNTISYIYDATGMKLEKEVNDAQIAGASYTFYAGNYIYNKDDSPEAIEKLTFFNTAEGYVEPELDEYPGGYSVEGFDYVYQYKDHLGNIRLSYQDMDGNGSIDNTTEIKEENHYYPFGLKHRGYNNQIVGKDHPYGFNGMEEATAFGNNMLEMDMRHYDAAIARWIVVDPVTHHDFSPYQAFDNNPIFWADPSGADSMDSQTDIFGRNRYDENGLYIRPGERGEKDNGFVSETSTNEGNDEEYSLVNLIEESSEETSDNLYNDVNEGPCDDCDHRFQIALADIRLENAILSGASDKEISRLKKILMTRKAMYADSKVRELAAPTDVIGLALHFGTLGIGSQIGLGFKGLRYINQIKKINFFGLNDGFGLFGRSGFKIGNYKIEALYANPTLGRGYGTIFSIKQLKEGGALFRWDFGLLHNTNKAGLHSTIRFYIFGKKFGSTAQRTWYPPYFRI